MEKLWRCSEEILEEKKTENQKTPRRFVEPAGPLDCELPVGYCARLLCYISFLFAFIAHFQSANQQER